MSSVKDTLSRAKLETDIRKKEDWYSIIKRTKSWETILKITDFFLEIVDILQNEDSEDINRKLVIEVKHKGQKDIWTFSSNDICDLASFKKKIKSLNPSCSFFDMDTKALDELIRYIQYDINVSYTIIVNKKWYIPKYDCWMLWDWVIYKQKLYKYNDHNVADLWHVKLKINTDKDNSFLPYFDELFYDNEVKQRISKHFNHMFWEINWDLVIGFLVSSLFVNNLKRELKPFPILFISWKRWSWKTTAIENALKILWINDSKWSAESDNVFVDEYHINKISSLPYWSDEFKNKKKTNEKESFYKTTFDRNWVSKGTIRWKNENSSLWVNKMDVNATLILSWEQTPIDDAVYSRICLVDVPSKRSWDMYEEIKRDSDYYNSVLKDLLLDFNFTDLVFKYKNYLIETKKILKSKWVDKRLLDVYWPIVTWFYLFKKEILWEDFEKDFYDNLLKHTEQKEEENEDDIIEEFFDEVVYLADRYHIWESEHIRYNEKTDKILFNFQYLYMLYNEKSQNKVPKKVLKKYIISKYNTWDTSMSRTEWWIYNHVMSFDLNLIPEALKKFIPNWDKNEVWDLPI